MAFSITYEIVTPESAEHGEAEEQGYVLESVTLSEAMSELRQHRGCYVEADGYPVREPRWFTFYETSTDYRTGAVTSLSLHLPRDITPSSARRIARLVGCYGI